MGNFKTLTTQINAQPPSSARRTILRGSVGTDGENLPSDLRLISTALSKAGLLSADASPDQVKHAISNALRHIQSTTGGLNGMASKSVRVHPADHTERVIRRAIAEFRYPTKHRDIALSAALLGARAIVDCGMSIARRAQTNDAQADTQSAPFRRALLPPLSPQVFQSNRRIAEMLAQTNIDGLDRLIAKSIHENGKAGYVEVRDFFSVFRSKHPAQAQALASKVKRRLRGKPRRRFIKLLRDVSPTEDDFVDCP